MNQCVKRTHVASLLLLVLNSTFPFLPKGVTLIKDVCPLLDYASVDESSPYEGLSVMVYVSDEKDVSYSCVLGQKMFIWFTS